MKKIKYLILVNVIFVCVWLAGKTRTETTTDYNINITLSSEVSPNMVEQVKDAVTYFSKTTIQSFVDNDWKFVLLDDFDDSEEYEHIGTGSTVVGLINYPNKTITIRGSSEYQNAARDIAIHELCHYVDRIQGNASGSDKLKELYEKYKDGKYITFAYAGIPIKDEYSADIMYATSSPQEFFAETMKDYLLHPEYLKEGYPDIYKYHANF